MRLALTTCTVIVALSTAALAQVADPSTAPSNHVEETDHNALMYHSPKEMIPMEQVDQASTNMLDNGASPAPNEPR